MEPTSPEIIRYRRAQFVTRLPVSYRYTAGHAWLAPQPDGRWRVGFTKFATRMLGEIVDHAFQVEAGAPVQVGQIVGWVEGFKAISDVYCVGAGRFLGANSQLKEQPDLVNQAPYGAGWLYELEGAPDPKCVDAHGYREVLDRTIDQMRARPTGAGHS